MAAAVLQEDVSVTQKRSAVRDLYDKIKMAIDDVQYKQEKVKRKDHEGDNVSSVLKAGGGGGGSRAAQAAQHQPAMLSYIPAIWCLPEPCIHSALTFDVCCLGLQVLMDTQVLALACMTDLLSGDQRRRYTDLIDSPFMPALRAPVPLSHVDRPKKLPTAPQVRQHTSTYAAQQNPAHAQGQISVEAAAALPVTLQLGHLGSLPIIAATISLLSLLAYLSSLHQQACRWGSCLLHGVVRYV